MCLAPYNLQSSTQDAKSALEEVMGEAFDVKELINDGTYIKLCDLLKKRYNWCSELIEMLALPIGPYTGMRVAFSNWKQADQLDIKSRISDINDVMSELMKKLEKIKLRPLGGKGMVDLGISNTTTLSIVEHAGPPADDEEAVVRFVFEGTTYLRTLSEESVVFDLQAQQVGRYDAEANTIDFSYRSD